jgi:hypothetical protein
MFVACLDIVEELCELCPGFGERDDSNHAKSVQKSEQLGGSVPPTRIELVHAV